MKGSVRAGMGILVAAGSLVALLVGLLWLAGQAAPAYADPGTRYVAVSGEDTTDCSDPTDPCRTVQFAVDAADAGDVIKVAAGVYTGVNNYGGLAQVLYISETLTVQGGYTTTGDFAGPPDPETDRTTLDAEGQGRGVYITDDIAPTLEGLRITGGDATGLGGALGFADAGGGVYGHTARATISGCVVLSNTASTARDGYGGGLYLFRSAATLQGNTVVSNTASTHTYGFGGGLYLYESAATLEGNTVQGNIASTAGPGYGGGLRAVSNQPVTLTLTNNLVAGNTASTAGDGDGGGLALVNSSATLKGNTVVSNTATLSSTATGQGGGLSVETSHPITLTNNLVAGNQANTQGSGLWFGGGFSSQFATSGCLLHTTIADNVASDGGGQGVFVGDYTTLAFTNTLIAGHSGVGITVAAGSTATLTATLWYGNGARTGGGGSIFTGTINIEGDPAFVDPATWDYHLGLGSAAIDAGVAAGVNDDIDGDARPQGAGYDIGADESVCVTGVAIAGPPAGIAGQTYAFTATITPANARPPIVYAWSPAPESGQGTAQTAYTWASGGPQTISVTVTSSCGPVEASHTLTLCQPLSSVTIDGPLAGIVGQTYPFTATVAPGDASLPITYSWSPAPDSGQGTAQATYTWTTSGSKTLAVTAGNCGGAGTADDGHVVVIGSGRWNVYLPLITRDWP